MSLLRFLGGVGEVGKSAVLFDTGKTKILLDYGVKLQPEPPTYPPSVSNVEAVIPTHAHLDHSGAVPILFSKGMPSVVATKPTLDMMDLLIRDFMKVARKKGYSTPFDKNDFKRAQRNYHIVDYGREFFIHDVRVKLCDAGHIPGSACVLLEHQGKTIFYTGDIKLKNQLLVNGCELPKEKIDVLIIESTYADRSHPERSAEERNLKEEIDHTINQEEIVLVPSFAVARAQEMMLMLKDYLNYLVLDGMAKDATEILLRNLRYVKKYDELKKLYGRIRKIRNNAERKKVLRKPCVIISTGGMLNGGPAVFYLKKIRNRRESLLAFVGFQVEGTAGKSVLDTGIYRSEEQEFEVNCRIRKFDFSSHAGRDELIEIIKRIKPKKVVCVHGDKCAEFAREIEREFGIETMAPKEGEELRV